MEVRPPRAVGERLSHRRLDELSWDDEQKIHPCGVFEQTVRKWLHKLMLQRHAKISKYGHGVPAHLMDRLRKRAVRRRHQQSAKRLTGSRVSEIIAAIGKESKIVVRQTDPETGRRFKYASAHDLRRSLAERLINAGVSAETLMVIMRHKDFATTLKHYGGRRAAQSAAAEVHQRLTPATSKIPHLWRD